MQRPWVQPAEVKEYSESAKVAARSDVRLAYDIARAERYVIYHTHNRFDTEEYEKELPQDVRMAVILLAEAYAKQAITQKEGAKSSVEIIFSFKFTILCDGTIRRKSYCHRIFYHLFIQHGKRSRHTGTYRTGVGIGSATERCGTAAEYFRLRGKLYMNFQTDHCFILFCHNKYLSVSALLLYICVYFLLFYFTLCS